MHQLVCLGRMHWSVRLRIVTVANTDAASWWLTHCPVLCPRSLDRVLPSLHVEFVLDLGRMLHQLGIPNTRIGEDTGLLQHSRHMLATDDGWGGHNDAKCRAPSDNILNNSGKLLTSPCVNPSWKSACRSSNQFVTSLARGKASAGSDHVRLDAMMLAVPLVSSQQGEWSDPPRSAKASRFSGRLDQPNIKLEGFIGFPTPSACRGLPRFDNQLSRFCLNCCTCRRRSASSDVLSPGS